MPRLLSLVAVMASCAVHLTGTELPLDREWLSVGRSDEPIVAVIADPEPRLFSLAFQDEIQVLWKGRLLATTPTLRTTSPPELLLEFTVPADLRTPGFTHVGLWDADRGVPLAQSGRIAVIIPTPATVFEVAPEQGRIVAYEPNDDDDGGGGGRIVVFDLESGRLTSSRDLAAPAEVLAFTPDTLRAWIAADPAQGRIERLDLETGLADSQFQLGVGAAPYEEIEMQIDRSDPRLLIVRTTGAGGVAMGLYRDSVPLPSPPHPALLPLAMDDRGRYLFNGQSACRFDPDQGFVDCVDPYPGEDLAVDALWKDVAFDSNRAFDLSTGEPLLSIPGHRAGAFYLPESNRVLFDNDHLRIVDADELRVWREEVVPVQVRRIWAPDWLMGRFDGPQGTGPRQPGILVTRYGPLAPTPSYSSESLVNAASGRSGPIVPGEILSIFGRRLGPREGVGPRFRSPVEFGTGVGGVRVRFDGVPAAILYAGPDQINLVAPESLRGRPDVEIRLHRDDVPGPIILRDTAAAAPGLFAYAADGRRYAAALDASGQVQGPTNPLRRGEVAILFATGLGLPARHTGAAIAARPAETPIRPTIRVGGQPAELLYAGASPGLTAGLTQINVVVPTDAPTGAAVEVVIEAGGRSEGDTWLAVQ